MSTITNLELASVSTTPDSQVDRIGNMLVEMGKLVPEDVDEILRLQKKHHLLFGTLAVSLGMVEESDVRTVLSRQFGHAWLSPQQHELSPELVTAYHPFDPNVEILRGVRCQLKSLWFGRGHKALSIAGICEEDGSSFLAANLAVLFSQLGERTLLIDANLRKPRLHTVFNLRTHYGIADMLIDRAGMEVLVQPPAFCNLSVLPAGTVPPNPQELVGSNRFAGLHSLLSERFDVIIQDVAPFSVGMDAVVAASGSGAGMLLAVRKNKTRAPAARAASEKMAMAGIELVGSVLLER
jgi:protein-tyrosine kinase